MVYFKNKFKDVSRFLLFRFSLLGVGVLVLGGLLLYFFNNNKTPPKDVLAVAGSLIIPATTQTFSTTNLNVANLVLGGTTVTATAADLNKLVGIGTTTVATQLGLKAPLASPIFTGTVSLGNATVTGLTKTTVGLGNVDNTSDAGKPVSTAQQTAFNLKANIASPTFTTQTTSPFYNVTAANGNGLRFWASDSYKIPMGNATEYLYGPVSDYSIKMNMGGGAGRGFTWGTTGIAPVAALNATTGNFQTAGDIVAMGNVGIGTTAPGAKLEVAGSVWSKTVNPEIDVRSTTAGYGDFGIGTGWTGAGTDKLYIYDNTDAAIRLVIDTSGSVGIGTTGPGAKLDVQGGNINTSGNLIAYGIQGNGNVGGTGSASWHPSGIYSAGTNWLYGSVIFNGALTGATTANFSSTVTAPTFSGNLSGTWSGLGTGSFSRKDTTGQWIKPYYEYSSALTTEAPSTLASQMGGGGLRVDFMNPSYTANGQWGQTITWSGYNWYGMYQLAGGYGGATPSLAFRNEVNAGSNTWTSWRTIIDSGTIGSQSVNYANSAATATNANACSNDGICDFSSGAYVDAAGDIYGSGGWIISAGSLRARNGYLYLGASDYDAVRGNDSWLRLNGAGSFTSGVYTPGVLRADGNVTTPILYDQNNTGYYVDPNGTSSMNVANFAGAVAASQFSVGSAIHTGNQFYCNTSATCHLNYSGTGQTALGNSTGGIYAYGNVGIKTAVSAYYLDVGGAVRATTYATGSDIRLKENIHTVTKALDTIKALRGVTFRWKDYNLYPNSIGFIAQEVETILPQVVQTSANGYKSVNYDAIIPIAVTAIQEQQTQITSLQSITTDFINNFKAGLIETKRLIVDGVDILKKLNELSLKVESQQKQIEDLKKSLEELKK